MSATDIAQVAFRSASELGARVGLTAQEFNVALKHAGLLDGEPGAYHFTELGKRLATTHLHDNGYGGYAARAWDITTWPETVTEMLDLSEDGIAGIRQFLADRRAAQWAAIKAERAAADVAFRARQAAKQAAEAAPDLAGGSRTWVLVGIGAAAGAVVLWKAVPIVRRRWQQRAGAPEPARDHGERGAAPEGE